MKHRKRFCHWCRRRLMATTDRSGLSATRDHIVPKVLGGTATAWCCRACNHVKDCMTPQQWVQFMAENERWWELWKTPISRLPPPSPPLIPFGNHESDLPLIPAHQRELERLRRVFGKREPSPNEDAMTIQQVRETFRC